MPSPSDAEVRAGNAEMLNLPKSGKVDTPQGGVIAPVRLWSKSGQPDRDS